MNNGTLHYNNSKISYQRWGTGSRLLVALHGYGEAGQYFRFIAEEIPEDWTIIAPDFPFHGETVWQNSAVFDNTVLHEILKMIRQQEGLEAEQFCIIGYSMGGRVALSYYQHFPREVEALALVAPDGLTVNFWYWLSTQTRLGNKLFRYVMHHPTIFRKMVTMGRKLSLVNQSIYKFIQRYINDVEIRQALYTRWTTMRLFRPDTDAIRHVVTDHKTPVLLVYGRHDRIITPPAGERFRFGLEEQIRFLLLPTGHQLLHPTFAGDIVQQLVELVAEKETL